MKRMFFLIVIFVSSGLLARGAGVSFIQSVEHGGVLYASHSVEEISLRVNLPLYPGDVLDTRRGGRVVAALSDGTLVFLDRDSRLALRSLAFTDGYPDRQTYLHLSRGSVLVLVPELTEPGYSLVVGTSRCDLFPERGSLVRCAADSGKTEIRVLEGWVRVSDSGPQMTVHTGERVRLYSHGVVQWATYRFMNEFERWAHRRILAVRGSDSLRYVSPALYPYSYILDGNGTWVYVSEFGTWVWRPAANAGWRPYVSGYWKIHGGGYYWVGYEPWGTVTYHYGRWSWSSRYGWIWVPGDIWSPAWVYWVVWGDWIGWCPAGYYDTWWSAGWTGWGSGYNTSGGIDSFSGRIRLDRLDVSPWVVVDGRSFLAPDLPERVMDSGRVASMRNQTAAVFTGSLPLTASELANPRKAIPALVKKAETGRDLTGLFAAGSTEERKSEARKLLPRFEVKDKAGASKKVISKKERTPVSAASRSGTARTVETTASRNVVKIENRSMSGASPKGTEQRVAAFGSENGAVVNLGESAAYSQKDVRSTKHRGVERGSVVGSSRTVSQRNAASGSLVAGSTRSTGTRERGVVSNSRSEAAGSRNESGRVSKQNSRSKESSREGRTTGQKKTITGSSGQISSAGASQKTVGSGGSKVKESPRTVRNQHT